MKKILIERGEIQIEIEPLFTFDCETNGRVYFGYSENSFTEDGKEKIFVASYDPIFGSKTIKGITLPEEFEMVEEVIKKIKSNSDEVSVISGDINE